MDFLVLLENYGIPVVVAIAFGFFIWKQNKYIQDDLTKDIHVKFNNIHSVVDKDLRMIIIKLIDQQKKMQIEMRGIRRQYETLSEIITKLSGNGLSHLFKEKK
tara:strand:- start:1185 stop:1493 length:309 start_codon:yes stop_codon:yes gene_type:complete